MNGLTQWGIRHHVPAEAIAELRMILSAPLRDITPVASVGLSEAAVQNNVRLAASKQGWLTFRNNSGAGKLDNGSFVRWGLCNNSASLNAELKSSDLIGIRPVKITPDLIGSTVGQFVALECKEPGWKKPSNDREYAQERFIQLINAHGGCAKFTVGQL